MIQGADSAAPFDPASGWEEEPAAEFVPADAEPAPVVEEPLPEKRGVEKWRDLMLVEGRDRELVLAGVGGALAGVGLTVLLGLMGGR